MEVINGKVYPMWSQFVEKKQSWIGGEMFDIDDLMGRSPATKITDVSLKPNGTDSAYMMFHGETYSCGFDVQYGGISGPNPKYPDYLVIATTFGNTFYLKQAGECLAPRSTPTTSSL